jgi:hypothetical protein
MSGTAGSLGAAEPGPDASRVQVVRTINQAKRLKLNIKFPP